MLKLGVWKPEQFHAAPPHALGPYLYYRLSRSRVSLRLLRDAALFERLMPHVRLANGVYRTTFARRFLNLDPQVNRILLQCFSPSEPIQVEDWAASGCLTSCEWAESLFPIFPRLRFVASDRELFLVEVERKNVAGIFVAEPDGRLIQYIRPPFVIRMEPPEPWPLLVSRVYYLWALRRWQGTQDAWPLPRTWVEDPSDTAPFDRQDSRFRKLPLIHPRALVLARTDTRFAIRRHSVFDPAPSPCHAIRSMNILNKEYFSDPEIATAARSAMASLHPGGVWIVGRTIREDPSIHDASIFRKSSSGSVEVIARIGAGSDIQDIALAAGLP